MNDPFKSSGAIAQLGERLHRTQEVSGSIPLSSTNFSYFLKPILLSLSNDFIHKSFDAAIGAMPLSLNEVSFLRGYLNVKVIHTLMIQMKPVSIQQAR